MSITVVDRIETIGHEIAGIRSVRPVYRVGRGSHSDDPFVVGDESFGEVERSAIEQRRAERGSARIGFPVAYSRPETTIDTLIRSIGSR
ncbi:hypothetical protein B1756_10990 [Natrarchaeobaculum aegyptiacum]|uniref:Uncharacterized protein n=1 Tax=Natrarchaeobaculum aegyptiacum TaxID=745377 RepID=A0A2Z2HSL7_9EURY|nr:hypothetical protein B1756_10990 [Natrarchaeobaculum aegyptiacum]